MKRCLVILLLFAATYSRAGLPPVMRVEDAKRQNLLLTDPRPEYPLEARLKRLTGKGVFELRFNYDTGRLREIHIATSTGHWTLDRSVIATLKDWQAKPHSLRTIRVPIAFLISDTPPPR
jgi:TonB family protein